MFTPYDWQEGIGNRAQYIESKLAQGAPVLALSVEEGILVFTYRRQVPKIYEIYDRLLFAAIGQQSDMEGLRSAALEFASREGYNRSDEDVTVQRVAISMSGPIKRAFSDFSSAPVVARSLFAEVNEKIEDDLYYVVDYDGDYAVSRGRAVIAGTLEIGSQLEAKLAEMKPTSVDDAVSQLQELWLQSTNPENDKSQEDLLNGLQPEALLLERSGIRENRFRFLFPRH